MLGCAVSSRRSTRRSARGIVCMALLAILFLFVASTSLT